MNHGSGIEHRAGLLMVDCGCRDGARDVPALYRAFAAECLAKQIDRVLVKAADCSPDGHYALRDALTVMLLAGMPSGFKLAMVTGKARIHSFFLELQRDLQRLSIDLALFADEEQAVKWLQAKAARPAEPHRHDAHPQA